MKQDELKLALDHQSGIPLYVQLKNRLRYDIQSGKHAPGEQLPTIREMAVAFAVDVNTVARVYAELENEGLLQRKRGKGTFVAQAARRDTQQQNQEAAREAIAATVELLRGMNLSEDEIASLLNEAAKKTQGG
ncbi:MAG: hypothetical protein B1H03_00410 [Planctomycetales bacterium 4484_113]|nr:MAG: hypothetical protein B1H03_00410 [Planctomycetales bacterium 4484_113]